MRFAMASTVRGLSFGAAVAGLTLAGVVFGAQSGAATELDRTGQGGTVSWQDVVTTAQGQTVYWNAWAGDDKINGYIGWVAEVVEERYGVTLTHVKVSDTAQVVARVLAEKTAGRETGGSVDLIWINGENFLAMKSQGLLFGPFVSHLPNMALTDPVANPTLVTDFTVPTDGFESPWGMSQLIFAYDSARVPEPPRSLDALAEWVEAHPGRFTYPAPPDFMGSTFLKQVLVSLTEDPEALTRPVDQADFDRVTQPMWDWLTRIRPHLWRGGMGFPSSGPAQRTLLDDGEVDFYLSFHPGDATSAIERGLIPETVRTYIPDVGSLANTHFVAIPFNASAVEAAMVVANFLLSPEAQARKLDPQHWGDDTVLSLDKLSAEQRTVFDAIPQGIATIPPDARGTPLPEPHPSWMSRIEEEWLKRHSG